jgi:DNA-directed RNA polymerase subunit E'/Rpb7
MSENDLVSPYVNTEFYSRISLLPHQMNNEIYIHLKNNLKQKIEKKCNKFGYVTKLYKILDYSDGEIIPENFDSSSIFNIKYSCRVCLPIEKTNIICKIDLQNKALIKAVNGPIIAIIKMNQLNSEKFTTNNKGDIIYNKNNKIITVGDHIIIHILALNFFSGDERQIILGSLIDIPTSDQIKEFYSENFETEKIENVENNETEDNYNNTESSY